MIWFNAQQIHQLQKSQMVQLEHQGQKIKVTAWKYNRFVEALILEVAHTKSLTSPSRGGFLNHEICSLDFCGLIEDKVK